MTKTLLFQAASKFALGLLAMGVLLFLPAGTFGYWHAWLLLAVLFVPMLLVGAVLLLKNPELLKKRLQTKEQQREQTLVIKLSALMFLLGFLFAGLNFRYEWFLLPDWVSWVAGFLFLLSYGLYAEVLRENTYLSRTVEVQEGQQVIDSGLYGIVRHPMYSATVLLFLSMPLILSSPVSFLLFLIYPALLAKRIEQEEALLEAELEGYAAYKQRVKYKMIPYIW